MAQKCAKCGSADTTTGAGSISCLSCGAKTVEGPVLFDNDTTPVERPAPPVDETDWTSREDVRPAPQASEDETVWVSAEVRDRMVANGEIAPREGRVSKSGGQAKAPAKKKS